VDLDPSNYFFQASNTVLLFELWISIPRIISFGPAASSCYSSCGPRSLKSFLFGQQRHFLTQVINLDFMDHFFWNYHIHVLQDLQYPFIDRGRFHSPPSLCTWAISAINLINYGHQSPDFPLFGANRASASIRVEILAPQNPVSRLCSFLFTRILVAIYQFGCRMSNMKISPQLATLDGPVIASNALC
jgi:hypothetical protein